MLFKEKFLLSPTFLSVILLHHHNSPVILTVHSTTPKMLLLLQSMILSNITTEKSNTFKNPLVIWHQERTTGVPQQH